MSNARLVAVFSLGLLTLCVVSVSTLAEPGVELATLQKQLKRFTLKNEGANFLKWGAEYHVDPRLIVAIAGAETTYGDKMCGKNNAWNWFWAGSCAPSEFDSFDQGIKTVSKFMRKSYFLAGYTTIEQIQTKYCAEGCEHWVPNVTKFYRDEMGGDPGDLTYSKPYNPGSSTSSNTSKSSSKNNTESSNVDKTAKDEKHSEPTSWFSSYGNWVSVGLISLLLASGVAFALFFMIKHVRGKVAAPSSTTPGEIDIRPRLIAAEHTEQITLFFHPAKSAVNPVSPSVIRVDSNAVPLGVVGAMQKGPDGAYSLTMTLSEAKPGAALFQVWTQYPARPGADVTTVASGIAVVGISPARLKLQLPKGWNPASATEEFRLKSSVGTASITVTELTSTSLDSLIVEERADGRSKVERVLGGILVQKTEEDGLIRTSFYTQNGPRLLRFSLIHEAKDPRESEYRADFDSLLRTLRLDD